MLTEIQLFHKREHKAQLRRFKGGGIPLAIAIAYASYEHPTEAPRPSPAPPSVTNAPRNGVASRVSGFFRRLFNRKV